MNSEVVINSSREGFEEAMEQQRPAVRTFGQPVARLAQMSQAATSQATAVKKVTGRPSQAAFGKVAVPVAVEEDVEDGEDTSFPFGMESEELGQRVAAPSAPVQQASVIQRTGSVSSQGRVLSRVLEGEQEKVVSDAVKSYEELMGEYGSVQLGEIVNRRPIDLFKLKMGEVYRISVVNVEQLKSIKYHYSASLKQSFQCYGGKCCEIEGEPLTRYLIPIIRYYTDRDGEIISDKKYEVYVWRVGYKIWRELSLIGKTLTAQRSKLDMADLLIECTEEKYQACSIQAIGPAYWRESKNMFSSVLTTWEPLYDKMRIAAASLLVSSGQSREDIIARSDSLLLAKYALVGGKTGASDFGSLDRAADYPVVSSADLGGGFGDDMLP